MRIAKLLVLSTLCLFETNAWAVDADVWTKPEVTATVGFEASESTSTYFYLYNVGAKKFFTEGNAWGTQASVGSTGLKVAFVLNDYYYLFNDFSLAKNAWKQTFFDTETAMYVDHNGQANYYWGVEENGSTFRLFAHEENPGWEATTNEETGEVTEHPGFREGMYVGLDLSKNADNTALSPYLDEAEGHYIDWALVTEEVYSVYKEKVDVYNAAMSLKTVLDEAESINAQVADQVAVYNNTASTVAELNAAATAAKAAIAKRKEEMVDENYANATVDNPVVVTDKFLKNTTFEGNKYDYWLGSSFGEYGGKDNAERYNMTYDTYQDVNGGLKAGVYAIGVNAFYRAGGAQTAWDNYKAQNAQSEYAKLYGRAGQLNEKNYIDYEASIVSPCSAMIPEGTDVKGGWSTVTDTDEEGNETKYIIPNNMEAAEYAMHTMGFYANKVIVAVKSETDTLRVGVRKSQGVDTDWTIFDDFSLTYYGAGADAAKLYLDESLKNFDEVTVPEGTVYTEKYLTDYQEIYVSEKNPENFEAAVAIVDGITNAKNAIDKNIELWGDWQALCTTIEQKYLLTDEYSGIEPEIDNLADYNDEKEDFLAEAKWTNEELEAEIAKLNEWVASLIEKSKLDVYDGKNMTQYIKNPGFDEDKDINSGAAEGWTIDKGTGTNIVRGPLGEGNQKVMKDALGKENFCFEAWHRYNWDVWQEVENLPVGMYELQVQGYVRCEMEGYTRGNELEDPYNSPVYLYMNDAMSQFPSVYSEEIAEEHFLEDGKLPEVESHSWQDPAGATWPNSMGAASLCFGWDMYKTTAYGLIAKQGDKFRIGVKMVNTTDWWCIWDSFKLTYRTPTVDIVKPELEKALQQIDTTQPMGKNVIAKAQEAKQNGEEALAGNDGQKMFDALAEILEVSSAVRTSVELFKTLTDAIENENTGLQAAIYTSANAQAKAEAQTLQGTITSDIENYNINDDEVAGLLEQIAKMKVKLAMPADWESATDQNPADFTGTIVNPDFVNPETGLSYGDGWTNPGNPGNDDTLKGAQAMEFWQIKFDMYQVIQGLPKGTYIVQVDAWCRTAGNQDAMNGYQENPDSTLAFVYAVGEDSVTFAAPVVNLMKGALIEDPSCDGIVEETLTVNGEQTPYYLPNTLIGGKTYMDPEVIDANEGVYTNKVIAKVGDDGKLRIGIKKDVEVTSSWVVCDSWKLFYCGANSQLTPSGDLTLVETLEAQPARIEFYSVGGSRISKPGKGIAIMKKVMSDGSVKVQKVIIK